MLLLGYMQENIDSCENFLVHFLDYDPSLVQTHPQWSSMGMPKEEEAGRECQQHSMDWTLADPRNKSFAKTRGVGGWGGVGIMS